MSMHVWRHHPKATYRKPLPSEGTAVLTSRQAAIAETLSPKDLERIHEEAEEEAARIMADWEGRR